jgi:hypothetical protein
MVANPKTEGKHLVNKLYFFRMIGMANDGGKVMMAL